MWKQIDLRQFLEKHNQDLDSSNTTIRTQQLKNPQNYLETEVDKFNLNSLSKRCNYCQTQIPVKHFERHITQKCKKNPNSLNSTISENNSSIEFKNTDRKLGKKSEKIEKIVKSYNNNKQFNNSTNNRQIQISSIAEKLNKPVHY